MTDPEQHDAVAAYGAAWLATDDRERLALLEQAWAPDGVYCDPLALVTGREALAAHIAQTQASLAGGRVEVTSEPARHHDSALFHWRITDAAGATVLTGLDVVQVDDAGRIRRLTGFFDEAPAVG
ncbi:nuclear transport factor 2 family protein [Geodermatophilus normandii]|uniref:Nuclear transport factor 2 family protein n=1 Tax=Geodermatophilus normandii TaxID=1137989 RepID=A0A6P0GLJ7_9ACTN|nr:nuclear transport factor 2 family protein [Geodermatophilus normandii]